MITTLLMFTALTSELPVDKAAHFGVSWAMNHTAYTVCNKITEDKARVECLVGASVGTLAVGVAKEIVDGNKNTRREHIDDLIADTAGVVLSSVMITISW